MLDRFLLKSVTSRLNLFFRNDVSSNKIWHAGLATYKKYVEFMSST